MRVIEGTFLNELGSDVIFVMLNSSEHEIFVLINVKTPTIQYAKYTI